MNARTTRLITPGITDIGHEAPVGLTEIPRARALYRAHILTNALFQAPPR
jgi:hypothetical protein